eukprot:4534762-Prymnesium_polylepis.1
MALVRRSVEHLRHLFISPVMRQQVPWEQAERLLGEQVILLGADVFASRAARNADNLVLEFSQDILQSKMQVRRVEAVAKLRSTLGFQGALPDGLEWANLASLLGTVPLERDGMGMDKIVIEVLIEEARVNYANADAVVRKLLVGRICGLPGVERTPEQQVLTGEDCEHALGRAYSVLELQTIGNDVISFVNIHGGHGQAHLALKMRLVEAVSARLRTALAAYHVRWDDAAPLLAEHVKAKRLVSAAASPAAAQEFVEEMANGDGLVSHALGIARLHSALLELGALPPG